MTQIRYLLIFLLLALAYGFPLQPPTNDQPANKVYYVEDSLSGTTLYSVDDSGSPIPVDAVDVPIPFNPAYAIVIIFIGFALTTLTMQLALISHSVLPFHGEEDVGRIIAIGVDCFTIAFLIFSAGLTVSMGLSTNETTCNDAYIVCAVFWVIIKLLAFLYFNEKLYIQRKAAGLDRSRTKGFWVFNLVALTIPFIFVLWTIGYYRLSELQKLEASKLTYDQLVRHEDRVCYLGFQSANATFYLLIYAFWVMLYIALSFAFPLEITIFSTPSFPEHPAIHPQRPAIRTRTPSATPRKKPNGKKWAVLNLATSIFPIANLIALIILEDGEKWWLFLGASVIDCVLSAFIFSICEGRSKAIKAKHHQLAFEKRMNKKYRSRAQITGICDDCGKKGRSGGVGMREWFDTVDLASLSPTARNSI